METLVESYWYSIMETEETDISGEEVESQDQAPGGADPAETADPDFQEVSEMLREGNETSSPEPSETPVSSSDPVESVDYIPYLENITVQLGVIDIVLVLALLIFIIKQFVRVPR